MADTQTIKDRIDVVQLIQEYLPLKKAGANWKAPCPFHHEKTPSFMVHPEKQIWHCFGCGKGGDIFTFIQEIEGMDFPEALKLLADRAGIKIDTFRTEIDKSQKNRLLEINAAAASFYHQVLLQMPQSKIARDYLDRRQLKAETIEDWKIGFIPGPPAGGWDLLTKYLLKKGYGIDDLVASGLTIKRDGADASSGRGYYDRFRGRVMFPIWDVHDNDVGFTGRVLVETEMSGGKYVNTPQSPVYDKSRVIYGLNKAKMEIKSKDFVVLVEGQMDVIACHQNGMKNVVASSGTALTSEQVKLLKRYSNNISIAFDADSAGQNAAKRGIDIAMEEGMNIKVIRIPEGAGKDADECLKKNPDVWFKAVEEAKGIMDWYFESVFSKKDIKDLPNRQAGPQQKQQAAETLLLEIIKIPYAVEQDEWIKKLAEKLSADAGALREAAKKLKAEAKTRLYGGQEGLTGTGVSAPSAVKIDLKSSPDDMIFSALFALLVKFPGVFDTVKNSLKQRYFEDSRFLPLYELYAKRYNGLVADTWSDILSNENKEGLVDRLFMQVDKDFENYKKDDAVKEATVLVGRIKSEWTQKRRQAITREIAEAEKNGDKEKWEKLEKEMAEL